MDCIFCKIISGEFNSDVIYEDDILQVIFDKFPANYGHCLIISKMHYENIYDINDDIFSHMMKVASIIAKKLKILLNCDGINIIQNNEVTAGQTVFHIHIHVIPRYKNDDVTISWKVQNISDEKINELYQRLVKK